MLHPNTVLKFVNDDCGYGVYANKNIPKGTIIYVKDELDIELNPQKFSLLNPKLQEHMLTYAYLNNNGNLVLSWDNAKYVNHSCSPNTMLTAYGFDIVVRDIKEGEEITCEYGLLNIQEELNCMCNNNDCRGIIKNTDIEKYSKPWDDEIISALNLINKINQPLVYLIDDKNSKLLSDFINDNKNYISVVKTKNYNLTNYFNLLLESNTLKKQILFSIS